VGVPVAEQLKFRDLPSSTITERWKSGSCTSKKIE